LVTQPHHHPHAQRHRVHMLHAVKASCCQALRGTWVLPGPNCLSGARHPAPTKKTPLALWPPLHYPATTRPAVPLTHTTLALPHTQPHSQTTLGRTWTRESSPACLPAPPPSAKPPGSSSIIITPPLFF
jgi:hypothetical protein